MKNKSLLLSILILFAVGLAACGPVGTAAISGESRTVTVNGTGKIILAPDMAIVNVGVVTDSEDVNEASVANAEKIEAIQQVLIDLGVEKSDIKTANFNVYPLQQFDDQGRVSSVTYRVENTLQVKVYEIDNIGGILDAVIEAGANSIYGVQFDLSDREGAYAQAIESAMQNALSRAEVLAQAAGAQLDEIQSVNTYLGGGGMPVYYAEAAMEEGAMRADIPISPGEMEIQVEVTVVYKIK